MRPQLNLESWVLLMNQFGREWLHFKTGTKTFPSGRLCFSKNSHLGSRRRVLNCWKWILLSRFFLIIWLASILYGLESLGNRSEEENICQGGFGAPVSRGFGKIWIVVDFVYFVIWTEWPSAVNFQHCQSFITLQFAQCIYVYDHCSSWLCTNAILWHFCYHSFTFRLSRAFVRYVACWLDWQLIKCVSHVSVFFFFLVLCESIITNKSLSQKFSISMTTTFLFLSIVLESLVNPISNKIVLVWPRTLSPKRSLVRRGSRRISGT